MFENKAVLRNIEVISFQKYTWQEDRALPVAKFFSKCRHVRRVEILTIYDCNKAISSVLEAISMNKGVREFRMAINAIGADEFLFIQKMLIENRRLESLDISFEIVPCQKSYPAGQARKIKKSKDNYAVKCLDAISLHA